MEQNNIITILITQVYLMLLQIKQFYRHVLNKMGLFTLLNFCVSCSLVITVVKLFHLYDYNSCDIQRYPFPLGSADNNLLCLNGKSDVYATDPHSGRRGGGKKNPKAFSNVATSQICNIPSVNFPFFHCHRFARLKYLSFYKDNNLELVSFVIFDLESVSSFHILDFWNSSLQNQFQAYRSLSK